MSTEEVFSFIGKISESFQNNLISDGRIDVTGLIVVVRDMVVLIIQSSFVKYCNIINLIGTITAFFFKRFLWGAIAILPLACSVILNFGLMGHFGITLNHVTAILSSIIIGVGVDFAIHFISQFNSLANASEESNISKHVIRDVGYPIVLDAGSKDGIWCSFIFCFYSCSIYRWIDGFGNAFNLSRNDYSLATASELLKKLD